MKIKECTTDQAERVMTMEKVIMKMAKETSSDQAKRIVSMERLIMRMAEKFDIKLNDTDRED